MKHSTSVLILAICSCAASRTTPPSAVNDGEKPRARDLGIPFDGEPGPLPLR